MKGERYRILGWLIPTLCMALAVLVFLRQNQGLQQAELLRQAANRELQTANLTKVTVDAQKAETHFAAAKQSLAEQTYFLTEIRTIAEKHGAIITSWTSQAAEYGKSGNDATNLTGATAATPKDAELLKGIVRISSTLTLTGPYQSIRSFLGELMRLDRLYNLSRVTWSRSKEGTSLVVTVARYVGPTGPSADTARPNQTPAGQQP